MSLPLQKQPDGAQFMLRRQCDGKWMEICGWSVEWGDDPTACCPIFTKANMGLLRRDDFHRSLWERFAWILNREYRCHPVRVFADQSTQYHYAVHPEQPYSRKWGFPREWVPGREPRVDWGEIKPIADGEELRQLQEPYEIK